MSDREFRSADGSYCLWPVRLAPRRYCKRAPPALRRRHRKPPLLPNQARPRN